MSLPYSKRSMDGKHITTRCWDCGDSTKSNSSTNMSISVDIDKPMLYQCFRSDCLSHGILDQDSLNRLSYDNYDIIMDLAKHNRKTVKSKGVSTIFKGNKAKEISNVVNPSDDKINKIKLKYINNRLGLNLSFKDIYNLKINLNAYHLLKFNNVAIPAKLENLYRAYGDYGVSFISAYNDYVIVRDISKDNKLPHRYNNINIFNNYDEVTKIYVIPTKLDLLSPEKTILNVSEGGFDQIGVYHHLEIDREYTNQIHAAACGAGLVNVAIHYIRNYGLTNIRINIFSDNDVKIHKYYPLRKLKPYVDELDVNVYYNTISKDFGVPKKDIKYSVTKL